MRAVLANPLYTLLALALLALPAGCGKSGKDHPSPSDSTAPATTSIVTSVALQPAVAELPLSRVLDLETTVPVRVQAVIASATESRTWRFAALDTVHQIPLIGFKTGQDWTVTLTLIEDDGTEHLLDPLIADRSELSAIFPTFQVNTVDAVRAQPGFTLLNLRSHGDPPELDETWTLLDESLTPVWMSLQASQAKMVFQRADGLFMGLDKRAAFLGQYASARDLFGNVVQEWHTDESWEGSGAHVAGTFAMHHDLIQLPNGNFAALTKEPDGYPVDNFPTDYADSYVRQDGLMVNADRVIEFTEDGTVVSNLALGPLMDPGRIGYDSLDSSFLDGRIDWIHANGLAYDATSDAYIVSFRHQDAVIKVDRASGQIVWILGTPTNWNAPYSDLLLTPDASVAWPYHQHSPNISSDGQRVIVFDNGNWRASPWDGTVNPDDGPREMTSRVVEFQIDEVNRTVTQNWQFQPPEGNYGCPAVGGADYLDNGNILATFALVVAINGTLISEQGYGDEAIRILEFDPSAGNEVVSDVWIASQAAALVDGWQAFAAHRIASPYPPGTLLE